MIATNPLASRHAPKLTNHAPQTKNCKNIINERRSVIEGRVADMGIWVTKQNKRWLRQSKESATR